MSGTSIIAKISMSLIPVVPVANKQQSTDIESKIRLFANDNDCSLYRDI